MKNVGHRRHQIYRKQDEYSLDCHRQSGHLERELLSMNKKSLEDSRVEQKDSEWPPPPKVSQPQESVIPNNSLGEPLDAVVGLVLGFFSNIVVVVGGSLLIIIVGTMIHGFSQYGQTTYPPILPYFVLDIMFVFCQSPTVLLFFSKRRQKGYYAHGILLEPVMHFYRAATLFY